MGYSAKDTGNHADDIAGYDVIVNTVAAPMFSGETLKKLKPGCFCLDLASFPGGIDMDSASVLGVHAVWALGLPAKTSPLSAAEAIRDTVYNILKEVGKTA